jgi:hypothetical protein
MERSPLSLVARRESGSRSRRSSWNRAPPSSWRDVTKAGSMKPSRRLDRKPPASRLIQEPAYRRGFRRTGVDVDHRWQQVREKAAAIGIQRHVSANGQEVLPISDSSDVVRAFVNSASPSICDAVKSDASTYDRSAGTMNMSPVSRRSGALAPSTANQHAPFTIAVSLIFWGGGNLSAQVPPAFSVPILTHRALASVRTSARGSPSIR